MRILIGIVIVIFSIPVALYFGYSLYPDLDNTFRFRIYLVSFFVTIPLYIIQFVFAIRKPLVAVWLVLIGVFIRLTACMALSLWLLKNEREFLRPGLLLFLVTIGVFLVFEIVSILSLRFRR